MFLLHIGLVAANLAAASSPTHEPITRKRKASELELHLFNAGRETYYENSLFNRAELQEIEDDFKRAETAVPLSAAESARERYMLFDFMRINPFGSLRLLLEQIQTRIPASRLTLRNLERMRENTMSVSVVPTWFHDAMMSLEPLPDYWNPDMLPQLLAQAPPEGPPLAKTERLAAMVARIWFEHCVKPTRMNHPGGPFCGQTLRPDIYSLTKEQFNSYLDRFKQHVSRSF